MPIFRTAIKENAMSFVSSLLSAGYKHQKEWKQGQPMKCRSFLTRTYRNPSLKASVIYRIVFADSLAAQALKPRKKPRERECVECKEVRLHRSRGRCLPCFEKYRYWSDTEFRAKKIERQKARYRRKKEARHADQALQ